MSTDAFDSASTFKVSINCSRASSAESWATFSSAFTFSSTFFSRSSFRFLTISSCASTFSLALSTSASFRFNFSSCALRVASFCFSLFSLLMIWFFLRLTSSSNSDFSCRYFSLASRILSFLRVSAVSSASFIINLPFSSSSWAAFLLTFCNRSLPMNTPIANAPMAVMRIVTVSPICESIGRIGSVLKRILKRYLRN